MISSRTARRTNKQLSLAAWLALLAVAIQVFVVQTHVHLDMNWNGVTSLADYLAAPQSLSDPSDNAAGSDPDHCSICHEQMSGGRTIVLDGVFLLPPLTAIFIAFVADALSTAFGVTSHAWHGRAPPTA